MISEFEKHIYNLHLRASRQHCNKPFNYRKDFADIDPQLERNLKKLTLFFIKHKDIDPINFFNASYKLYSDERYLDLAYFNTLKAIKAYTIHNKNLENLNPDSSEQLEFTKSSLLKIYNFCLQNKILIKDYLKHKTNNMYSFLLHLKSREVNLYSLMEFKNLNSCLNDSDLEVLKFMFNDNFLNTVNHFKIRFLNSVKCKQLVIKGLEKLEKKLINELNLHNSHLL